MTGALHAGHALNNTLQDILIRRAHAGLRDPVDSRNGPRGNHPGGRRSGSLPRRTRRHQLGREGLVKRIWAWKDACGEILDQLKQMGCSCDWQRLRFTLDPVCARAVRHTFFSLFKERLIYRGNRLVNWDTHLQTAVADDEVFHETVPGHFWHIRYPVIDARPGEPAFVTIATTRPETMLGDTAVAVHPDPETTLEGVIAGLEDRIASAPAKEKPELEAELADAKGRRETGLAGLIRLRDMARDGRKLMLPLLNREIPLVADEWAKPEMGSGCVKITPAHDPNDYGRSPPRPADGQHPQPQTARSTPARANTRMSVARPAMPWSPTSRRPAWCESNSARSSWYSIQRPVEPYLTDPVVRQVDRLAQTAMDAVTSGRSASTRTIRRTCLDWLSETRLAGEPAALVGPPDSIW